MSEEAQLILNAMQSAVIEELQRKAKLGYKAVIAGRRGEAKVVSARYAVRRLRAEGLLAVPRIDESHAKGFSLSFTPVSIA